MSDTLVIETTLFVSPHNATGSAFRSDFNDCYLSSRVPKATKNGCNTDRVDRKKEPVGILVRTGNNAACIVCFVVSLIILDFQALFWTVCVLRVYPTLPRARLVGSYCPARLDRGEVLLLVCNRRICYAHDIALSAAGKNTACSARSALTTVTP